jgi:hypothetical protein
LNLNLILYGTKESPQKRALVDSDARRDDVDDSGQTEFSKHQNFKDLNNGKKLKAINSAKIAKQKLIKQKNQQSDELKSEKKFNFEDNYINSKRPNLVVNENYKSKIKLVQSSKPPTTVKLTTTSSADAYLFDSDSNNANANSDYYGSNDDDNQTGGNNEEPNAGDQANELEVDGTHNKAASDGKSETYVDINNSNENYLDYYNDVNTNDVMSKNTDQSYYDTSVSLQHSSMLRNGIQLSHERSSSGYNSSVKILKSFLTKSKLIVIVLFINCFLKNFQFFV